MVGKGIFMGIELFEHNQKTYEKLSQMFKSDNRVGVVQPTGTGKSFLFLKWIEDHPEDRFIVLSPSMEIFTQLGDYADDAEAFNLLDNTQMISYQLLNNMSAEDISHLRASKIIIDEFHRAGADQWGPALQRLLDANPNAKILGATATPVRYLDEGKNMADELFDNNLAQYMTLGEAVANDILPMPTYVPVWYDYDNKLQQYQVDIDSVTNVEEKHALEEKLKNLKNNLQNSYGAEDIFKKHMPHDHGKYIVFCKDYEHLVEMQSAMKKWLEPVNTNIKSYVSISRDIDRDVQLNAFKKDNDEGALKLLFTIDRLNEGLHVKGVDGVVMLRPTESPIIYLQQMGRALSAGKDTQPIIFDMVNNYANVRMADEQGRLINAFEKEFMDSVSSMPSVNVKNVVQFKIFEQMVEFSALFNDLESSLYVDFEGRWQQKFELLKEFISINGKFPCVHDVIHNVNIGRWFFTQKETFAVGEMPLYREALFRSIGVEFEKTQQVINDERWQQKFELLKRFVNENNRFPARSEVLNGERLGIWFSDQKVHYKSGKLSNERETLLRSIGVNFEKTKHDIFEERWQQSFTAFQNFINENNRFPTKKEKYDDISVGYWFSDQKKFFNNGKLEPTREALLRSVGVEFKNKETQKGLLCDLIDVAESKKEVDRDNNVEVAIYKGKNTCFDR